MLYALQWTVRARSCSRPAFLLRNALSRSGIGRAMLLARSLAINLRNVKVRPGSPGGLNWPRDRNRSSKHKKILRRIPIPSKQFIFSIVVDYTGKNSL